MASLDGLQPRYDVVIAGARAAGAATAMLLARRGLRVLAVDRGVYGSDTLSTHALMRAGVLQLARWDVLGEIVRAGTPPVHRTIFHYGTEVVDIPIKPRDGVPALFAPRRTVLDRVLVDAAVAAGADVRHRVRLSELLRGADGRVEGALLTDADGGARAVASDLVVGADGLRSAVAKLVDAPVTRRGRHACAVLYGYWSDLALEGFNWYWGPGVSAGAIPTNGGRVLLFAAFPAAEFANRVRGDARGALVRVLSEAAPGLEERLRDARLSGTVRAFPGHVGVLRRPFGPGWALVGDAASFKDPITAHGLSDSLRDAELLAGAIARGGAEAFEDYENARDSLTERLFDVSDRVASFAWDTAELKVLHQALSDEMKRETAAIVGWNSSLALAS